MGCTLVSGTFRFSGQQISIESTSELGQPLCQRYLANWTDHAGTPLRLSISMGLKPTVVICRPGLACKKTPKEPHYASHTLG